MFVVTVIVSVLSTITPRSPIYELLVHSTVAIPEEHGAAWRSSILRRERVCIDKAGSTKRS